MSRFSGPQGKGALRAFRERRRKFAESKQQDRRKRSDGEQVLVLFKRKHGHCEEAYKLGAVPAPPTTSARSWRGKRTTR